MQPVKTFAIPLLAVLAIGVVTPAMAADIYAQPPREAFVAPEPMVRTGPLTVEEAIQVAYGIGVVSVKNTHFDGDEWEIEGRDGYGKWIEVDVDARTGEVRNVDRSVL